MPPSDRAPDDQPDDGGEGRVSGIDLRRPHLEAEDAIAAPREAFEKRLAREILISERLRVQLLAAIPSVVLILFLALTTSYPDAAALAFRSKFDRLRVGLLLGGFAIYELFSLRNVERLIKLDKQPTVRGRYITALIETSLPTLVIIYYMTIGSPLIALLLPSAFIYFVFIVLST